jgi:hypothetical protein
VQGEAADRDGGGLTNERYRAQVNDSMEFVSDGGDCGRMGEKLLMSRWCRMTSQDEMKSSELGDGRGMFRREGSWR